MRDGAVACLGPEGTHSHQAVLDRYGEDRSLRFCPTLEAVLDAVAAGEADLGVVPVENVLEGRVGATLDALLAHDLWISAEWLQAIRHVLAAPRGRGLAELRRVYSHPQALAQCRDWLRAHLPGVETVPTSSTADACRRCIGEPAAAAIASWRGATLAGLAALAEDIQDRPDNVTRFLEVGGPELPPTGRDTTALAVHAPHRPGALVAVLTPFARAGVDLTRIESRPTRAKAWEYVFFLDVAGHRLDVGVAQALAALEAEGAGVRVLGSFPRG